jgi:cell division protein FtsB
MDLEALKQTLASLDINPDEIEDKRYATAFRILFAIIEKQNEEIEALKAENQKLRDEINLLKVNKQNLGFVVPKRMMISLLKMREKNEIL